MEAFPKRANRWRSSGVRSGSEWDAKGVRESPASWPRLRLLRVPFDRRPSSREEVEEVSTQVEDPALQVPCPRVLANPNLIVALNLQEEKLKLDQQIMKEVKPMGTTHDY